MKSEEEQEILIKFKDSEVYLPVLEFVRKDVGL